jgi:hypothetical protein
MLQQVSDRELSLYSANWSNCHVIHVRIIVSILSVQQKVHNMFRSAILCFAGAVPMDSTDEICLLWCQRRIKQQQSLSPGCRKFTFPWRIEKKKTIEKTKSLKNKKK